MSDDWDKKKDDKDKWNTWDKRKKDDYDKWSFWRQGGDPNRHEGWRDGGDWRWGGKWNPAKWDKK